MFTGIVEEMGLIEGVRVSPFYQLRIKGRKVLEGTKQADSIAVNGVCLTVIGVNEESFLVEVMPQTLNKTNLREVRKGDRVNLERSLSLTTKVRRAYSNRGYRWGGKDKKYNQKKGRNGDGGSPSPLSGKIRS